MSRIRIDPFYHQASHTITYVVTDIATRQCAIIDPVLDFDMASGTISTSFADSIIEHIDEHGFEVEWILETHAHSDHISTARYIKKKRGVMTGLHNTSTITHRLQTTSSITHRLHSTSTILTN